MKEERDNINELFRSKLYNFEADTMPEDWEAIASRLPRRPAVPLRRKLAYWAAAAVIALVTGVGTLHLYKNDIADKPQYAQEIEKETRQLKERIVAEKEAASIAESGKEEAAETVSQPLRLHAGITRQANNTAQMPLLKSDDENQIQLNTDDEAEDETIITKTVGDQADDAEEVDDEGLRPLLSSGGKVALIADAEEAGVGGKGKPTRRWSLGMGGGSLSMTANNAIPQYVTHSSGLRAENLHYMNMREDERRELPKTNIKHKAPLSFGLGVSYLLTDRWSIQSGISYTYLSSDWDTNGVYHSETHQALHYLGIPLNLMYRIATWEKWNFYASGGAMVERNIAGRWNTKLYEGDKYVTSIKEDIDMKKLMWSLNARIGISYPLLRFLSAYAEVGAGYYFDNGSDIETIRTEKPFNAGLQVGLRLGF